MAHVHGPLHARKARQPGQPFLRTSGWRSEEAIYTVRIVHAVARPPWRPLRTRPPGAWELRRNNELAEPSHGRGLMDQRG